MNSANLQIEKFLSKHPIFGELPPTAIADLAQELSPFRYPMGEVIFKKDEELSYIVIIYQGEARTLGFNPCDQQFSTRKKLSIHIRYVHKGIKYPCNQCDYEADENWILMGHIQRVHLNDGHKYSCDKCKQQFSTKNRLNTHICRIYPTKP